jgi:hypothetical protein
VWSDQDLVAPFDDPAAVPPGLTFSVHNGKKFIPVSVNEDGRRSW